MNILKSNFDVLETPHCMVFLVGDCKEIVIVNKGGNLSLLFDLRNIIENYSKLKVDGDNILNIMGLQDLKQLITEYELRSEALHAQIELGIRLPTVNEKLDEESDKLIKTIYQNNLTKALQCEGGHLSMFNLIGNTLKVATGDCSINGEDQVFTIKFEKQLTKNSGTLHDIFTIYDCIIKSISQENVCDIYEYEDAFVITKDE